MIWKTDRKSTRLNSSHLRISYAVFCLKKNKRDDTHPSPTRRPWVRGATRQLRVHAWVPADLAVSECVRYGPPAFTGFAFFFLMNGAPPRLTLFPPPAPFRS